MRPSIVLWIGTCQALPTGWPQPPDWSTEFLPPGEAIVALSHKEYSAVVLDLPLHPWDGCELLARVRQIVPHLPVLVHDPAASVSEAVRMARLGAHQFLTSGDHAYSLIEQAVEDFRSDLARLAAATNGAGWEHLLVGNSREMQVICHVIRLVAGRRATVLITGETGTGKELAARALHLAGNRRNGPLIAVNCSALPETLLESELFGHVRGAFTGAFQARAGRFEQAGGGTLFLDEIGELPVELQSKLLRVLQEREVQRLGSSETIRLDIRVVAATNCDLAHRVRQGKFREDLYYRLNVVPLEMPPLRRRPGDVCLLASHFVDKICRAEALPRKALAREALDRLCRYEWPGNVRQLENAVEMAIALSGDRPWLGPDDFLLPAADWPRAETGRLPVVDVPDSGLDYERTIAVIERSILDQALAKTGGNKKAAAEMLRLKRTTLSAKVRSLASAACN